MYTIELFKNVSAQRSYDNVRWFTSLSNQESYFSSLTKRTINNCTPIKNENMFYCDGNVEDYRDYSYGRLWFSENGQSKKKVYFFIDSVHYLNDDVFRLDYTIDAFQTYMTDINIGQTMVEREHVTDDTIGNYTLEEPVSIGDLKVQSQSTALSYTNDDFYYIINSTVDLNSTGAPDSFDNAGCGVYGGLLYGSKWYAYKNKDTIGQIIKDVNNAGKIDGILNIFMLPNLYIQVDNETNEVLDSESLTITNTSMDYPSSLDGYTPKNKKLLTYPYVQVLMTNNVNTYKTLRPERFQNRAIGFASILQPSSGYPALITPYHYNGVDYNYEYSVTLQPFPQVTFINNPYETWLNQNSSQIISGQINNAIGGIATGALIGAGISGIGAGVGAVVGGVTGAISSFAQMNDKSNLPNSSTGNVGSNNILAMNKNNYFNTQILTIKSDVAKSIDDFFTRYGYKVMRYKTPNINTRSDFNYVKTVDCDFTGDIPHDYMVQINNAFNRGITLWHENF
jgi:hypothetical protein